MKFICTIVMVSFFCCADAHAQSPSKSSTTASLFGISRIKDPVMVKEIEPLQDMESHEPKDAHLLSIPMVDTNEFYSVFEGNGIEVMLTCENFHPSRHGLTKDLDSLKAIDNLKEIDGKPFWGSDHTVPETKVSDIKIKVNGITIPVPVSASDGMYNPNFGCNSKYCYNAVYQSKDKKRMYILMNNSDGAGFYQVIWIIKDDKYYDRVILEG